MELQKVAAMQSAQDVSPIVNLFQALLNLDELLQHFNSLVQLRTINHRAHHKIPLVLMRMCYPPLLMDDKLSRRVSIYYWRDKHK